jgi:hypothetical protein
MAISEFDRFPRHFTCAVSASKLGGNEICVSSRSANFIDCPLPAFAIPPHNQNMHTKLSKFPGCRETDSAGSSRDKRSRSFVRHF